MTMFDRLSCKARTKRILNQWVYGKLKTIEDNRLALVWDFGFNLEAGYLSPIIDTETICQCTGLKDSDGFLIYENDYFEIIDSGIVTGKYLVQYHQSLHFQIKNVYSDTDFSDLSFVPMWLEHGRKVKVVGNRFDEKEYK